ncbi:hypothetical protein ILUMI_26289 [Ignelater luminosus]|uniref:Peptidase S1 domain-containing protein n=1 Tax=Ignelater luminosus TaxID=2038154 RepID=A0A8K0C4H7_IGNLU|nr:hypothetical protein ILUMI_26289 [Ignelater luminosus]
MCYTKSFLMQLLIYCFPAGYLSQFYKFENGAQYVTNDLNSTRNQFQDLIEKYPYMAALVRDDERLHAQRLICSVAIVASYFALSAAHCFKKYIATDTPTMYAIRGNNEFWSDGKIHLVIDFRIYQSSEELVSFHSHFRANLAVIKVEEPFTGEFERPIRIAPPGTKIKVRTTAVTTAWAAVDTTYTTRLKAYKTTISDKKECRLFYRVIMQITVTTDMVCAYAFRDGFCFGDSGGAMVQNDTLIGISSFGRECTADHVPDIYTKIPEFSRWIHKTMDEMKTTI